MRLLHKLLAVASVALFIVSAHAQNTGTVTNHAFALGKGAGKTGYTSLLCGSAQLAVGQSAADPICQTLTGDVTINVSGVTAIGANKVTNSQLATMANSTFKCRNTAGTGNAEDCTSSQVRTLLSLVIGTNVEAWDNDLDCIAALSSTGQIKRTGTGTCSAGAVALADLATGTQDTVIGYFGSTTASATAISNCTGALTYSTSTHTFGCNAAAGTGTVTNVATAGLATGGPITTTGTVTVTAASKSDEQTGSSAVVAVTPSQQQQHDSAAKAWLYATQSAGTYTLQAAYNIAGFSKTGTGAITVTMTTAFASTSYSVVCSPAGIGSLITTTSVSSASVFLLDIRNLSATNIDANVACHVFGRQ